MNDIIHGFSEFVYSISGLSLITALSCEFMRCPWNIKKVKHSVLSKHHRHHHAL